MTTITLPRATVLERLDFMASNEASAIIRDTAEAAASIIRAALAQPQAEPAPVPQQWQPIETAPRDGSKYILVTAGRGAWIAHWMPVAASGYRFDQPWRSVMLNHDHIAPTARYLPPTHWMPLPSPPSGEPAPAPSESAQDEAAALFHDRLLNDATKAVELLREARGTLVGAANYIDNLGGVSISYRQHIARIDALLPREGDKT